MLSTAFALTLGSFLAVQAQQIGTFTPEVHPPITYEKCTAAGGCETQNGGIVLDANYRWVHNPDADNCHPNGFNVTLCPDAETCASNCAVEGADYEATYGITTSGDTVTLVFGSGGSRVYLLNDAGEYESFHVLNQEFTFDVDVSEVPCAFNGALYFSEMPADGGLSDLNKAGAAYGTGYCDAQCPTGNGFFNGTVNVDGTLGACCNEMDLWEANSAATALTPHTCNITGVYTCTGAECKNLCDSSGCDFNPYRMGNQSFYGPGANNTVDTTQKFTVVTQFITDDGTAEGTLVEIKRFYVQNDVVIPNSVVNLNTTDLSPFNSITDEFCDAKVDALNDASTFQKYGSLPVMGQSLARGAVLVMSLWNDLSPGGMGWLDGLTGTDASVPGALRGPCGADAAPADPTASVSFSGIKVGDLNSTFSQPAETDSRRRWHIV